ncbi:hypothetical protein P171DRAFT_494296 [Karstenula rhodostoma CBS 690.94]|uniref:SEC7 domain-containing protein n=1 Tax=Karstenula rhodostoma CBS 690.94 TaxID=1392251 RepID=A0A9P4UBG7_9PLEO|nr:hypothetical protein P171DRAFT_494296 [Karstenula rhodostoma CBS 690.94]
MAHLSSRDRARDGSRPSTPPGPSRTHGSGPGMRALDTRPTQSDTFLDDETPVDNRCSGGSQRDALRDSHDLSFADGTRDSVVDNMLLSLDQLSLSSYPAALYSTSNLDDDQIFFTDNSYAPPKAPRVRSHTNASSHSSDYDLHADDSTSRFAPHHARGRRSNSSNNISNAMSRREGLRGPWADPRQANEQVQQSVHMRGGKGSKSSMGSSVDFGKGGMASQRLGLGRRSISFDHGNLGSRAMSVKTESIRERSRPTYPAYHPDYEAAPQPTIPAGPRRALEPQSPATYAAQPSFAPAQAPPPRRKNSVRSAASYRTLRKNKSHQEPNMRLQAQEFVNAANLRDFPPIPTYHNPPAPSPNVATRKHALVPLGPVPAPKEKPGFFRRVFGSALPKSAPQLSNTSTNSNVSYMTTPPASSTNRPPEIDPMYSNGRPRTTPHGSNHIVSQLKSAAPRPPQAASSAQTQTPHPSQPTLAKKHSSFFRRRKKSVTEPPQQPPMPVQFQPPQKLEDAQPQSSPGTSSLRQVMNPYLGDIPSPIKQHQNARELSPEADDRVDSQRPNGFSPGYKPHKDAIVRSVKPGSRDTNPSPPSSRQELFKEQLMAEHAASTSSPKLKLKLKNRKPNGATSQEDTFLADSSSCNEDGSGRATPSGELSAFDDADETPRPGSSPTAAGFPLPPNARVRKSGSEKKRSKLAKTEADSGSGSGSGSPSAPSRSTSEADVDDGWILTAAGSQKKQAPPRKKSANGPRRVWLEPTSSEERLAGDDDAEDLTLPLEGARSVQKPFEKELPVPPSDSASASSNDVAQLSSSLPTLHIPTQDSDAMPSIIEHRVQDAEPSDADRECAFRIFSGDDPSVHKGTAAADLGDMTAASTRIRKAFMALFDWAGFNILGAMRDLCGKVVLRAETQQIDRILMSLSERWCECNPNHGFKATDVVHTICYSILLLNTDLHVADIESRMTRSQFVKNTLPTVVRVCKDALKDASDATLRPQSTQFRRGSLPWNNTYSNDRSEPSSPAAEDAAFPADPVEEPIENRRARSRLSLRPPYRSGSEGILIDSGVAEGDLLVGSPYNGPMKGWELHVETVLKDFYDSIRKQRLPLHGVSALQVHEQPSTNNLSVSGMLRRSPSVLSKAPSDNTSYRGRSQTDFRTMGKSWNSKTRSRPRLYPSSTVASSRTSLDDQSVWSPAGSSTWSRYSHGKTQTSMSMESLGSHFAHGDYQQAIGFANALSQAIIREEGMTIASDEEFTRVAPLLEDETLELTGAPWAKEGILKHKHHLEALDKKAKDRTWNECFAVIEKGYVRLFSFNMNAKSMRSKKSRPSTGGVVGGGNWMDNAEALDSFLLRQTIASALPPPGYSKSRPHVWALSLPTGAVHLFQVGTPDIVREFVSTANYWSARLSKEPLMGGVSNIEYGWGENVINTALIRPESTASTHGHVPRPSMASSMRSSMDHGSGTIKARLPGDKVGLNDWNPPTSSMMASNLMEVDQLRALTDYVKNIEDELSRHNELRAPMLIAFSPRHPNAAKAMANWERKSSYLLREIVKFRTYIDSLAAAQILKRRIYAEREASEEQIDDVVDDVNKPSRAKDEDGAIEALQASEPIST